MCLTFSFAKTTENKCLWAVRLFNTWKLDRNERVIRDPALNISPIKTELLEMTKDELCYVLSRFILEVRKVNGDEYPSETLYEIIIFIQLYLECNGRVFKFLNDDAFTPLKNTLDARMKELSAKGRTTPRRRAEIITEQEYSALILRGN